jgi:hypothetical protein
MAQTPDHNLASSIHSLVDWTQARLNERESWDGLTLIILSLLLLTVSSLVVYVAWAGVAYGGWILWKKGDWKRLTRQDNAKIHR